MNCNFRELHIILEIFVVILRGRRSTQDPALDPSHFPVHTLHSTLYTPHLTLDNTPHSTLDPLHSTPCTPHATLHAVHSSHCSFTPYSLHSTPHARHCTRYTLHSPHHTPPAPYTLNFNTRHFTLHTTLQILHYFLHFHTPRFKNLYCTLYLHSTLESVRPSPDSFEYTLHILLFTDSTPHNVHSTLHTLHARRAAKISVA